MLFASIVNKPTDITDIHCKHSHEQDRVLVTLWRTNPV